MRQLRTESKVKGLGREVPDDIGSISSPEREETFLTIRARERIRDTLVGEARRPCFDPA